MNLKNLFRFLISIVLFISTIWATYLPIDIFSGNIIKAYIYVVAPFLIATIYCFAARNDILNWKLLFKIPVVLCLAFCLLGFDMGMIFQLIENRTNQTSEMFGYGFIFLVMRFMFYWLMAYVWYPAYFEEKKRQKLLQTDDEMNKKSSNLVKKLKPKNIIVSLILFTSTLLFATPMSIAMLFGLPFIYVGFIAPYYMAKNLFLNEFENVKQIGWIYKIPIVLLLGIVLLIAEMFVDVLGENSNAHMFLGKQFEVAHLLNLTVETNLFFWIIVILIRIVIYSLMIYVWLPKKYRKGINSTH